MVFFGKPKTEKVIVITVTTMCSILESMVLLELICMKEKRDTMKKVTRYTKYTKDKGDATV